MNSATQSTDQASWDELVSACGGHVLQSWAWGELKAGFGWRVERLSVGPICAQVLYRALPGGLGTIAYVPKGPLAEAADPTSNGDSLQAFLEALRPLARKQGAICLKIEPDLEDDPELAGRLRALGFRPSPQTIQPRRTILLDLQAEPDDLMKRMKSKTRYNIRLAGRKGVTVRPGDESDLPAFYTLMEVTAERDGFGVRSQSYYETAHHLLVPPDYGRLLLAEHEGQLLGAIFVTAFGDTACYMYGASSNEGRKLMPNYLLQWEGMLWARERGCRIYDLWGVPDEDKDKLEAEFTQRNDGMWGVYRFKRGFGGRLVRSAGAWDLVYSPLRYQLYCGVINWLNRRVAA